MSDSTRNDAPMSDDDLLAGLWWSDPEYPEWCSPLWHAYVERLHGWNKYRAEVADLLRRAMEATDA